MGLLSFLHQRAKAKHKKLASRLAKSIRTGRFDEFSARRRNRTLRKVEKQRNKYNKLALQLAIASGVGIAGLGSPEIAQAQSGLGPFNVVAREDNPLRPPIQITPAIKQFFELADIDNDGDIDLYVSGYSAGTEYIYLFENLQNDLAAAQPIFKERQSISLPLNIGFQDILFSFVDADGDTDLDLFVSRRSFSQPSTFFRNEGTPQADLSNFVESTFSVYNIFDSNLGYTPASQIAQVDIDGDGDLDFFAGTYNIEVQFLRNDAGTLVNVPHNFNAGNLYFSSTAFIDLDQDGDQDAFIAEKYGTISFYRNDDISGGDFVLDDPNDFVLDPGSNPLNGIDFGTYAQIEVEDIDGDADLDMIVGFQDPYNIPGKPNYDGANFRTFLNDGAYNFTEVYSFDNPFGGVDVERIADPAWVDIDGDGDMDVFIGSENTGVHFFENVGGTFVLKVGAQNPLDIVGTPLYTSPSLADTDGDGDFDAYIGTVDNVLYHKNDGNATGPAFSSNAANSLTTGALSTNHYEHFKLGLGPLDLDADVDAIVGSAGTGYNMSSDVFRFDNTNPFPGPPNFVYGDQGPFFYVNTYHRNAELVDIDHDGDLDIVSGGSDSGGSSEIFEYNPGWYGFKQMFPNPLGSLNYLRSAPSFMDYDNDGDLDLFIGTEFGTIELFQNQNLPPVTTIVAGPESFIEGALPVTLDPTLTVNDPDNNEFINRATVTIVEYEGVTDILSWTDEPSLTENYSGGVLTVTDTATVAEYQALLRSITFENTGDNPGSVKTIVFEVWDNDNTNPVQVQQTVNITAVNDPPTITSTSGTAATEDIAFTYTATVNDPDDANNGTDITWSLAGEPIGMTVSPTGVVSWTPGEGELTSGTVTLTVEDGDEDSSAPDTESFIITVTPVNDAPVITSTASTTATEGFLYTYNPTVTDPDDPNNGTDLSWSLSGEPAGMTVDALGVVTWTPGAVTTSGSVTLTVQDGGEDGALPFSEVFVITVTPLVVDAPPVLTLTTNSFNYTENDGALSIDPGISITDDGTQLTGGQVAITTNFDTGEDVLGFTDQSGITGTFDGASGVLTLTGTATIAQYETALGSLTFENTSDDPGAVTKTIEITLDDGVNSSAASTLDVQIIPVNDAPTISGSGGDLAYRSLTGTILVDDQISLADLDDTDIVGATVSVASSYSAGEDFLAFTDQNGIAGSFNSVTGVLTLSGTATLSTYETALRSISYENTSPSPSAGSKPIEFIVSDATTTSTAFSRTIVIASNQVVAEQIDTQVDVGSQITIDVITGATFTPGDIISTTITSVPSFGTAVVNADGTILYTPFDNDQNGVIDVITYELCNEFLSCGSNDINVTINNDPPNVSIPNTQIEPKGVATVALAPGIVDPNGNLDPNSLTVLEVRSGLPASIDAGLNLTVDYSGSNFTGADRIEIEICDLSGACSVFEVVIEVGPITSVFVFNGVTPNNDGINDVLRILDIEFFPENEMIIYNKLGRVIYNVKNYDNESLVFSGIGDDGSELEDGTYYYVIILDPNGDNLRQSGYIVLKRN